MAIHIGTINGNVGKSFVPMKESLLDESLVILEDVMNCPIRYPKGRGQILVCDRLGVTLAAAVVISAVLLVFLVIIWRWLSVVLSALVFLI